MGGFFQEACVLSVDQNHYRACKICQLCNGFAISFDVEKHILRFHISMNYAMPRKCSQALGNTQHQFPLRVIG
jgi:hypothetical protein